MPTDRYIQAFQDVATAENYEEMVYAPDSYASAISRRHRVYLRKLVKEAFPYRRPVQHDFACGTGRAIRLLHGLVRAAHGYDTSAAMLAKGNEMGVKGHLHHIEATGPLPAPATTGEPALVTIFRLLLNSGEAARDRAIAFAAQVLPHRDAGLLVVENHGNRQSLRHLRHRRKAGRPWFAELSHDEVTALLARHGFTVTQRHGFALFPQGWYGQKWLNPVVRTLDDVGSRLGLLSRYSVAVLYVARRDNRPGGNPGNNSPPDGNPPTANPPDITSQSTASAHSDPM